MHHRTIQINHQPDATIFQFIILIFIYSSTRFGPSPAHHQELNDCSSILVLPLYLGDSRAVFVVVPAGRTMITARLSPRYEGKTRGCYCSYWAPDDGRENAKTYWAVNKRQDNKLENFCIWLVIYLNFWIMFAEILEDSSAPSKPSTYTRQHQTKMHLHRHISVLQEEFE